MRGEIQGRAQISRWNLIRQIWVYDNNTSKTKMRPQDLEDSCYWPEIHTWSNCRSLLSTMGNDLGSSRGVLTWTAPCLVKIASDRDNTNASSLAKVDTQFCVVVLFCERDEWSPSVQALHRVGQKLSSKINADHDSWAGREKINFPSPMFPTNLRNSTSNTDLHWIQVPTLVLNKRLAPVE